MSPPAETLLGAMIPAPTVCQLPRAEVDLLSSLEGWVRTPYMFLPPYVSAHMNVHTYGVDVSVCMCI